MTDPSTYGPPVTDVEVVETHGSWVFLAGDRAYKVKKPIVLPFLDFGTLERRRALWPEEVRFNRRLAPRTYLRPVALIRRGDGFALGEGGDRPRAADQARVGHRSAEAERWRALAERVERARPAPPGVRRAGGKRQSTLAAALAERSGARHLSSDVVRKRLLGLPETPAPLAAERHAGPDVDDGGPGARVGRQATAERESVGARSEPSNPMMRSLNMAVCSRCGGVVARAPLTRRGSRRGC